MLTSRRELGTPASTAPPAARVAPRLVDVSVVRKQQVTNVTASSWARAPPRFPEPCLESSARADLRVEIQQQAADAPSNDGSSDGCEISRGWYKAWVVLKANRESMRKSRILRSTLEHGNSGRSASVARTAATGHQHHPRRSHRRAFAGSRHFGRTFGDPPGGAPSMAILPSPMTGRPSRGHVSCAASVLDYEAGAAATLLAPAAVASAAAAPTLEMALETGVGPMAPAAVAPAASLERAPRERARAEWRATSQLRDTAPDWWDVPQPVCEAADTFDTKLEQHVHRTKALLRMRQRDTRSRSVARIDEALRTATALVFATRYIKPSVAEEAVVVTRTPRAAPPAGKALGEPSDWWPSLWEPRQRWCDARDFFDTTPVRQKRFELDWDDALHDLKLVHLIMKHDDGDDDDGDGIDDNDGDGIPNEVEQVADELCSEAEWLYPLFYSYASLDGAMHSIGFNSWAKLVEDLELADQKSAFAKRRDLDTLFIALNATSTLGKAKGPSNAPSRAGVGKDERKRLSRVEFLGALVHVAILRYIISHVLTDVSEALHCLLEHVHKRVRPETCVDPDRFRAEHCYTKDVTTELARREPLLHMIFDGLSSLGGHSGPHGGDASLMSFGEWEALIKGLGFVGIDLSERDVLLTFLWSRMAVINGRTERGALKESCLPFEGFIEALCRIAVLKALPTDDEIAKSSCASVGQYLTMLRAEDEARYDHMLLARATPWGVEQSLQPTARCVAHVIDLIAHTIATDLEYEMQGEQPELSDKDVTDWIICSSQKGGTVNVAQWSPQ